MNHTPHRAVVRLRRLVIFTSFFFLLLSVALVWRDAAASGQPLHQHVTARATHWLARTMPGRAMLATFFDTQTVTSGGDATVGAAGCTDGCSLREAITAAAVGDTIQFSGVTTVTLTSGELGINKNLTIDGGTGVTVTRGSGTFRIFNISSGTVAMNNLTISNGSHTSDAGGILNAGTLTMTDCTVSGNSAPQAGGIQNNSVLTMTNCTVSGNTATTNSGGGVSLFGSNATLTNCTISGNTVSGGSGGGAISHNVGALTLTNCTLTNNTATSGELAVSGNTTVLKNTIVTNILGTVSSTSSFNIIGQSASSGGLTNGVNDNQVGVNSMLLATLGNYGGTTQTHALLPGSPAINAGTNTGAPTTDQRSKARVGATDIGAFESQGFLLEADSGGDESTVINTAFPSPLGVAVSSLGSPAEPVNDGKVTFTPPVSGASATIAGNPATITGGIATSGTVTANGTVGANYNVAASATGATAINFTLTNTSSPMPVLGSYAATNVALSGQTTVTPSAAPTNTTSIVALASSGFNGTLRANPTTGVVSIVNANLVGTHTITVKAFGSSGMTTASFQLTVQTGTACGTVPLFTSAPNVTTVHSPLGTAVGDFNNDGKQDLVTANGSNATASIQLGDGAGGFTVMPTVSTPDNPNAVAVGDFNGDGNQDIAVSSSNNAVAIRLGDGAGGFTGTTNITTGQTTKSIALGDFNNDGKLDFVTANIGGDNATVALGNGSGGFPTVSTVSVGDGPGQVVVADFNNDGNLDFATSNQIFNPPGGFGSPGTVTVRLGDGAGNFTNGPSYNVGDNPEYLAVGDFNEDGKPDLITSNQNSSSLSLILGDVSNTVAPPTPTTIATSSGPGEIRVADINRDGHQDIVFKRSGIENFAYLLGTGMGGFGTTVIVSATGAGGTKLAVGDFNGDGYQDFVTAFFGTSPNFTDSKLIVRLGGCNVAPTITPGGTLMRQQGSAGSSDTIATVNDTETLKQNLTVTVMSAPTGISVTSLSVPDSTTGVVTATVRADCNAATGDNIVVLKVTDGNGATATADLTVTVSAATPPTPANAGSDQPFCNITTVTLAANTPSVGTGAWSVVSGPSTSTAQFNSLTNPSANFTPSGGTGIYTLRWTITGACATSTDNVVLTFTSPPTIANAGSDQNLCTTSAATLAANTPSTGTGAWTVVSGPSTATAQLSSLTNPAATFTPAGGAGSYTLRWTISSGACTASTDDVILNYSAPPTTANAGSDQTQCDVTSVTMAGNTASIGTGTWTQVNGPSTATITSPNSPTTTMTGLVTGVYTFQWTIANAPCTASSDQVMVTINAAPVITTQPTNQSALSNGTATFMAAASGTPTPTVKWQVSTDNGANYTDLSGQNSTTLTLNNVTAEMNGNRYRAVFTNSCTTINSNAATLSVGCVTSLTVNNTGDGTDATPGNGICETATGNGICTLRAAIQEANALTSCTPFTINFNVALPGTITLGSDLPAIAHPNLTITGPGANQLTVSGASMYRPFNIGNGDYAVTISGLTVANGRGNGGGGLINFSTGQVNLDNMTFDSNAITASSGGGGIRHVSGGTLNITGSTFLNNNSTGAGGGGINNFSSSGTVNVTNCTFSGNLANLGGGIHNQSSGTINITNCTLVSNGGGINNNSGTVTVKNTIAIGNGTDINGTVTASNNLTVSLASALLSALGNYGGTTQTFALLPGSPAINAGTASGAPSTDQRGITRDSNVDIGAFESRGFTLAINSGNNQSAMVNSAFTNPLSVNVTSSNGEPVNGGQITFTPPGSGASAMLTGNPATIASGSATTGTVTAITAIGGPYNVVASANGAAASVNFALTNTNNAPTISDITNQTINEDANTGMLGVIIGDVETPAANLMLSGSSSNPTLVPNTNIVFGGSGMNRTVTVTPASNLFGSATITITVVDANGGMSSDSFLLTVNSLNDLPTITPVPTIMIPQGSSPSAFTIVTVSDVETAVGSLTITATNVPPGITLTPITNNNGTGTTTITVDCNAKLGNNTVELTVMDGDSGTTTANLTINVTANSAPIIGSYPNSATVPGGSVNVTPTAAPTDNGTVASLTAAAPGFTGTFSSDPTTGIITINNAGPGGDHVVTVTATDNCGLMTQRTFTLNVGAQPPLAVKLGDPAICLDPNGLVGVEVTVTNPNNSAQPASWNVTLPPTLTALPGGCNASVNPGGCAVAANGSSISWSGTLSANQTVTINYRARIGANVAQNAQLCLDNTATVAGVVAALQYCFNVTCPAIVNTRVSDTKPGSVLVFPYYTSTIGGASDTRLTISNISNAPSTVANQTYVHLFFIDGTTCQQADLFLCLTPNASFSFKASEYDPGNTGYVLAVAVNNLGLPIQNNVLVGNAFLNTPQFADSYGAESFAANGRDSALATVDGNRATLYFDHIGYDAVPKQFAVEIQSPVDVVGQQIVTAGLSGDLTTSTMSGAGQVGTGLAFNEKEAFGSFNTWLTGTCQARQTISTTSPRVPNGLGNLIKTGQAGYLKFNVGGAVGLLMTPRTASWRGIRTLHKTQTTATTITIPILVPVC